MRSQLHEQVLPLEGRTYHQSDSTAGIHVDYRSTKAAIEVTLSPSTETWSFHTNQSNIFPSIRLHGMEFTSPFQGFGSLPHNFLHVHIKRFRKHSMSNQPFLEERSRTNPPCTIDDLIGHKKVSGTDMIL